MISFSKHIRWTVRHLAPVCRVHHCQYSYGWVVLPWLPVTLGFFPGGASRFGRPRGRWRSSESVCLPGVVFGPAVRIASRGRYHNCTWTGVY